jgi:hypothetical protein
MVRNLAILAGHITASSSSSGAGIGSWNGYFGDSTLGSLTIVNSKITASSTSECPAIGGAKLGGTGKSTVEALWIQNWRGTVKGDGAAIGPAGDGGEVKLVTSQIPYWH